jgi:hypothetical protein
MLYVKKRAMRTSRIKRKFRAAAGNGIASLNLLSTLSFFYTLKECLLVSKAEGSDNSIGKKHECVSEHVFCLLNTSSRRYCRDGISHCLCIIICMI